MNKKISKTQFANQEAIKKQWAASTSGIPEYQAAHQFAQQLGCNTLKLPAIYNFGVKNGEAFLVYELIDGEPVQDFDLFAKAYSKLVKKMPKPLRQSEPHERDVWTWLKTKLDQYPEPESGQEILKRARTYLSQTSPKHQLHWTHTQFLPEHLLQPAGAREVYLINFRHLSYEPEFWGIARYFHSQQIKPTPEQIQIFTDWLELSNQDESTLKFKIHYNLIGLNLLSYYGDPTDFTLQWIDDLLVAINA